MKLRAAYDHALSLRVPGAPTYHAEFWAFVATLAGKSPTNARLLAARAGWPTTCRELGMLRSYRKSKPSKPPRAKVPHTKTACARLRAVLPLLAKHPEELASVQAVIARLESGT